MQSMACLRQPRLVHREEARRYLVRYSLGVLQNMAADAIQYTGVAPPGEASGEIYQASASLFGSGQRDAVGCSRLQDTAFCDVLRQLPIAWEAL